MVLLRKSPAVRLESSLAGLFLYFEIYVNVSRMSIGVVSKFKTCDQLGTGTSCEFQVMVYFVELSCIRKICTAVCIPGKSTDSKIIVFKLVKPLPKCNVHQTIPFACYKDSISIASTFDTVIFHFIGYFTQVAWYSKNKCSH